MNSTPLPPTGQPINVTVSALGRELKFSLPYLTTYNSAGELVCEASGIEHFEPGELDLFHLMARTLEDYASWREWVLSPEDHTPTFSPVVRFGMADPVEYVQ